MGYNRPQTLPKPAKYLTKLIFLLKVLRNSEKINKYLLYLRGHRHGKPSHLEATLASLCE